MSERVFEPLRHYELLSILKRVDHTAYMQQTTQAERNRLTFYEAAKVLDQRQRAEKRAKDEEKRAA
jgi:hypothetical protein